MKKKIANIVFYKFQERAKEAKQACIFYTDGTVANVSFDEGIDACEEIVRTHHIKSKDAFREMINKNYIHVVSENELQNNYQKYKEEAIRMAEEEIEDKSISSEPEEETSEASEEVTADKDQEEVQEEKEEQSATPIPPIYREVPSEEVRGENGDLDEEEIEDDSSFMPIYKEVKSEDSDEKESEEEDIEADMYVSDEDEEKKDLFDGSEDFDSEQAEEDFDIEGEEEVAKERGVKAFFKRAWENLKKNKVVKRIIVCVTAVGVALGLYSCAKKQSLDGVIASMNFPGIFATKDKDATDENADSLADVLVFGDNDQFNNYSFDQLLEVTTNETQKTVMTNLDAAMTGFNDTFASKHLEVGKMVRATLTFDEMVALQTAYNNYSKTQIQAYFNGADIKAADMTRAYKDASLQLMGAHVIETSESPVDMSMLLETQEAKDFYKKYHEAFLAAKEASDETKIMRVTDFYRMVRSDFPITTEVRTEGIAHSENYKKLESYKLSVAPMIAAAEMMWQNLERDVTLDDSEIDFLNDLGLCNYADETFERIETITLASEEDNENPLYDQYRNAIIEKYKSANMYYIDDAHRELTELKEFDEAVNWHFNVVEEEATVQETGSVQTQTQTRQETSTRTETSTTYHEEVTTREIPITETAKAEVDAQIAAENEAARVAAEQAAAVNLQQIQAVEDQKKEQIDAEVVQEAQQLQTDIAEANQQIAENNADQNPANNVPVNESDFGAANVQFDEQHSDAQGNLDNSVENITTDPTGDMTNEPLPDPNQTGQAFDAQMDSSYSYSAPAAIAPEAGEVLTYDENSSIGESYQNTVVTEEATVTFDGNGWITAEPVDDGYYYENAWVEEIPAGATNEQIVDSYVESMATDYAVYGSDLQAENMDEAGFQFQR